MAIDRKLSDLLRFNLLDPSTTPMLPFIPRSVARSAKPTPEPRVASLSASLRHPYISGNDGVQSSDQDILPAAKSKAKQSEATRAADEYAIVTSIALSDYALWSEPGLRRLVASGDEGCE